jgi:DNA-binding helix-hairpin-helix protein with protein kinase domain
MSTIFQPGRDIWLEMADERCVIGKLMGSGGQGQVYHVTLRGLDYALKWYFTQKATKQQRVAVERLVQKGPPNERFLWPMDIALCQGVPSFGYLMPLRDPRFRGMAKLMSRAVDPTFRTLTIAAIELAGSFLQLHSRGLCYSDISFGNIFLDPDTGEISICDNDSVALDGEKVSGIQGAPRFMAPELVRGEAAPNISTDLYSLSVLLFCMLMVHHPLEGGREAGFSCLDLEAMKRLYGTEALFIFDPKDRSNRPVPGLHDNALTYWNFYPDYLCDIFTRAFTDGLADPGARVRESEWRTVLTRMRDQIFYCNHCGAENFLSDEGDLPGPAPGQECWSCHRMMAPPLRLRLGHHVVVLNQDTILYAHHLDANRRNDYAQIMAEMSPHPKRADVWGLKNISAQTWISHPPVGNPMEVASGRSVSLVSGLRLQFGNTEGMVL